MSRTTAPPLAAEEVRRRLRDGEEIALLDVREEGPYARAHPLFAVNVPLSRIELLILELVPRSDAPVTLYDDAAAGGADLVARACETLAALGYTNLSVLDGGLSGWRRSGGELFQDVNVPSKAFGELVEAVRQTPSLSAEELHRRLEAGEDITVLDARRFEEYAIMSIPTGRSVPGGELALRVRDAAPDPRTTVVVNCAGRTRSIIGAQSLVNAAIPNPVFALRNGTIGWTLAGLQLECGAASPAPSVSEASLASARRSAGDLAQRSQLRVLHGAALQALRARRDLTLYCLDVRTPEEHAQRHLCGFRSAPSGQLVQATDEWIGVRHATIVLTDDDRVRARMAGHWLRQLGWREVYVLDDWDGLQTEEGLTPPRRPPPPGRIETIGPQALSRLLDRDAALLIDLAPSPVFRTQHIPSAIFALRADLVAGSRLAEGLAGTDREVVVTSPDGVLASFAAADLRLLTGKPPLVLAGGTAAWRQAGLPMASGLAPAEALSETDDVYKRPYEGTDNATAAMQSYLDWEFGLVAQLERDGTHGFCVLT